MWRPFSARPFAARRDEAGIFAAGDDATRATDDPDLRAERRAAHKALLKYVDTLLPAAVDEGSGDTFDKVIDAWADQWVAKVDRDYLAGQAKIEHRIGRSTQVEVRQRRLLDEADFRAKLAQDAVEAARETLTKVHD